MVHQTRYRVLGFTLVCGYNVTTKKMEQHWRFVEISDGAHIGPFYRSKAELLSDTTRYAELAGYA